MKTTPFYVWGKLYQPPHKNHFMTRIDGNNWAIITDSIENANTFKTKLEAYVFKYIKCFHDDPFSGNASLIKVTLDKDGNRLVLNYNNKQL